MNTLLTTSLAALFALGCAIAASAASDKPISIVLVHGAFADGSSWSRVIPLLEKNGYIVTAVQQPMTSLADDVAATKRVIDAQPGAVVLVGHSYGGAVITVAATENPKVKALVYIAAFAPEAGEALGPMQSPFSPPALASALVPDSAGFLPIDRAKFHDAFAKDVTPAESRVMAATQQPIFGGIFSTPIPSAAWKTLPSWYLVATEDRAINPDLERFMAKRIGAKTVEVRTSHVPFLTKPQEVAALIEQAANSGSNRVP